MFEYRDGMGSNRRYADQIDARMSKRISQRELLPGFHSLTPVETGEETEKVIEAKEPIPVEAMVGVTPGTVVVEAHVTAWTKRAVRIEWVDSKGVRVRVWVYAGAVTRR